MAEAGTTMQCTMRDEDIKNEQREIDDQNKYWQEDGDIFSEDGFRKHVLRRLRSENLGRATEQSCAADACETDGPADLIDSYSFQNKGRGLAVIISNESFNLHNGGVGKIKTDRPGSRFDKVCLYQLFKRWGLEVVVFTDLTASQMLEVCRSASKYYDHEKADWFVCAIFSHGDLTLETSTRPPEDAVYSIDEQLVPIKLIVDWFSDHNCPYLKEKPRLFFVQACRGGQYDHGQNIQVRICPTDTSSSTSHLLPTNPSSYVDAKSERPSPEASYSVSPGQEATLDEEISLGKVSARPPPLYKDSMLMYAAPSGYLAWRTDYGSWFIQTIYSVLSEHDGQLDLMKALHRVNGRVANLQSHTPDDEASHGKKVVPVIVSMLVKDIIL